jgi:hypothetical protein
MAPIDSSRAGLSFGETVKCIFKTNAYPGEAPIANARIVAVIRLSACPKTTCRNFIVDFTDFFEYFSLLSGVCQLTGGCLLQAVWMICRSIGSSLGAAGQSDSDPA